MFAVGFLLVAIVGCNCFFAVIFLLVASVGCNCYNNIWFSSGRWNFPPNISQHAPSKHKSHGVCVGPNNVQRALGNVLPMTQSCGLQTCGHNNKRSKSDKQKPQEELSVQLNHWHGTSTSSMWAGLTSQEGPQPRGAARWRRLGPPTPRAPARHKNSLGS